MGSSLPQGQAVAGGSGAPRHTYRELLLLWLWAASPMRSGGPENKVVPELDVAMKEDPLCPHGVDALAPVGPSSVRRPPGRAHCRPGASRHQALCVTLQGTGARGRQGPPSCQARTVQPPDMAAPTPSGLAPAELGPAQTPPGVRAHSWLQALERQMRPEAGVGSGGRGSRPPKGEAEGNAGGETARGAVRAGGRSLCPVAPGGHKASGWHLQGPGADWS